ncbi:AAA family ATPase [Marinobacterium weihaiense]|uniref:AAA family ATPase n=1 Tax=Marinobacterium weihaiense TaxID=2851016 RepID=A0ABS6MG62_9GAMM|nr:AAA family ATPase [Marinobacterium weihaiense]MBV0934796.1 AAA family ATPase [Marinobacterium weihaiense]
MHISEVKLINFRGAKELSLNLDEHLNVFVGMNGAGKSSILDASAIMLSWLVNRMRTATASGRPITESDIRNGSSVSTVEMVCEDKVPFAWSLAKARSGHSRKEHASVLLSATEQAKRYQALITEHQGQVNLPLFAYYPVNRAVLDIPLRIRNSHQFELLDAYDESLTSGANFRTFFEWFRDREDLENEHRRYRDDLVQPEGYAFPDPQLEAVRCALTTFMPEFKNLTVRRKPLRMEVEKQGQKLTVNQLSDGEKCLMAMIGDLARRLAIANPMRDNPLEGDGVILIDEVDLHLHPKWQRILIPNLRKVFPNCQFLVSTHSPHVITHVQPKHLHLLRMEKGELETVPVTESYGKNVDRILEDIMGLPTTRPDDVFDDLQRLHQQIQAGDLQQAMADLNALQERIGSDPELVKASVLIKRKELIGK